MHVKKRINKRIIFVECLLLLLVLTIISSIMAVSGVSAYTPNENDTINISFAEGSYYSTSAATVAIADGFFSGSDTKTLTVNSSNCIILPDGKLSGVSINSSGYTQKDDETFIFNSSTGWSYSFTGWHIVGASTKIPGKTVFQPGDVITPDVLEDYVSKNGSINSLAFEALWGKCYYGRNPYAQMVYSYTKRGTSTWSYPDAYASAAATGISEADALSSALSKNTNDGLTTETPKASIDSIFKAIRADSSIPKTSDGDITDAYSLVVMLTGDLDYMKDSSYDSNWFGYTNDKFDYLDANFCNFIKPYKNSTATNLESISGYYSYFGGAGNPSIPYFAAVTFKSFGNNVYNLDWKPSGNSFTSYCSFRFDNVNVLRMHPGEGGYSTSTSRFQEPIGCEFILYANARHSFDKYVEVTARCNQSIPAGRQVHFDKFRPNKHQYAVINGGGRLPAVHNFYNEGNIDRLDRVWRIGRNANIGTLYCGTESNNQNELVTINSEYDLYVTGGTVSNLYGGSNNMYTTTVGNRDIFVLGDSAAKTAGNTQYFPTIGNLFGAGYRARNFGNINVLMNQSKVTGSVYGGGDQATATVYGDVTLTITHTDITGSVYGGGKNGNTEKLDGTTYTYYKYHNLDENGKPMQDVNGNYFAGYSSSSTVYDKAVLEYKFNLEGTATLTDDPETLGVETVNIPLAGYDRIKSDILASSGNVKIDLQNSTVGGSVYGSGTGSTNTFSASKMTYLFTWVPAAWDAASSLSEGCYIKDGSSYVRLYDYSKYEVSGNYLYQRDSSGNRIGRISKASCPDMSQYTDNGNGTCSKSGKTYNIYTLRSGTGTWDTSSIDHWMSTAPTNYPVYEDGIITTRISKGLTKNTASTYLSYPESVSKATLSIATVENVDLDIFSSTVNGNVYGGGSIAKVYNDTNVKIRGTSVIKGTVFGGGDGTTQPGTFTVYFPGYGYNKLNWIMPKFDNIGNCSTDPLFPAQDLNEANQNASSYKATYTWSADPALLASGGFDHTKRLAYSPNMNDFGTVGGNANVTIENGTVNKVVGGGNKGNVIGNTTVNVLKGTVGAGLESQAVFGAGYQGNVGGNSILNIQNGLFNGYVYGGSERGKIAGNVNVTIDGGTFKEYFFAGSRAGDIGTAGNSATGHITTVVNDCLFEPTKVGTSTNDTHFIGGNNSAGTVYGNMVTTINGGSFRQTHGGNNGDNQDKVSGTTGANTLGDVIITFNGGTFNNSVYGGSNNTGTQRSVTVNVNCATKASVFGGGYAAKHNGTATINLNSGASVGSGVYGGGNAAASYVENAVINVKSGSTVATSVYGGGYEGSIGTSTVNAIGGTVTSYIFGGGYGTKSNVKNNTNVNFSSGSAGYVYGGSYNGTVSGNTNVLITGSANVVGSNDRIYGGGYGSTSNVAGTANLTIKNIDYSSKQLQVYGGGNAGPVGATNVIIDNSKLAYTSTSEYYGCVFGGGKAANVVGTANLTVTNASVIKGAIYGGNNESGTVADTIVNIDAKIEQRAYGGGRKAAVTGKASVYLKSKAEVSGDIYGGGRSATCGNTYVNTVNGAISGTWMYGGGESADVFGTATMDITGGTFKNRVLGGGSSAKVGTVIMNVSGGDFTSKSRGIHGAGANAASDVTELVQINVTGGKLRDITGGSLFGKVTGDIEININGGTFYSDSTAAASDYATVGSCVYGGCQSSGTVSGNVTINVNHAGGLDGVFGGGAGPNPVTTGDITVNINCEGEEIPFVYGGGENAKIANAVVNVINGSVPEVYGGGKEGAATGNTTVNISGDSVTNAYGGGNNGTVAGNTALSVSGGTVVNAFGAGNGAGAVVSGDASATVSGGAVTYVYGGGNNGPVTGNTALSVSGGTVVNAFGGGNGAGAVVSGSSSATVSGGTVTDVYGGGNNGIVVGSSSLAIKDGTVTNAFGGGNGASATVSENANVSLEGGTVTIIYGGGNQATVGKDINFTATGGNVNKYAYCGANQGDILGNIIANIQGGNFSIETAGGKSAPGFFGGSRAADIGTEANADTGNITLNISGGDFGADHIFAGNNASGTIYGNVTTTVTGGKIRNLFGGSNGDSRHTSGISYPGAVINGDVTVNVNGGKYSAHVYGGCNSRGSILGDIFVNVNAKADKNVYGGGYGTKHNTAYITVSETGTVGSSVLGGGNNSSSYVANAYIDLYGTVNNNVCGGGLSGNVGTTRINAYSGATVKKIIYGGGSQGDAETTEVNLLGASVGDNVYGGGNAGDVVNAKINASSGIVNGYLYGGGNDGNVDNTIVNIFGGTFKKDINGGGKNGTARATEVNISDKQTTFAATTSPVIINGNVFGGGEGANATVFESTSVEIDLGCEFNVTEAAFSTDKFDVQSGQTVTTVSDVVASSRIDGSIYGGGDRGAVGKGNIISGVNKADITTEGKTSVTVNNGYIVGSVFGGGRGKPGVDENYTLYMGTVFGSADVNIHGGYIGAGYSQTGVVGNVYGGGEQSRIYAPDEKNATNVEIDSTAGGKILITGSVFGGGDRGSDESINASVPTVVGDVNVDITGVSTGAEIYFQNGGVYGDGNLCIVSGNRTINITDLVTGKEDILKTFYSIQRADVVNLNNTEIVLLGAVDLVEEGDDTLYSINRVGHMYMKNGSTIKLDRIVKYLGGLESDIDTERPFLDRGNNGTNNYVDHGGSDASLNILNSQNSSEVENYIRGDVNNVENDNHNILCVANGLYVDVMKEDGSFGPVNGLFTLQLLHAQPGVGGGFVYGDIETSTGDFICTTPMSGNAFSDANVVDGITYMGIIDDVGKFSGTAQSEPYDYYYWYINGGTVYTEINLTGYLSTDIKEFSKDVLIPSHTEIYRYILEDIEGLDSLEAYINSGYQLVQTENVTGNQIAIEFKIAGQSVGFAEYTDGQWYLYSDGKHLTGLDGVKESEGGFNSKITDNTLISAALIEGNNTFECVFYKSPDIMEPIEKISINTVFKAFKQDSNSPPDDSAHVFNITSNINIKRINPTQSIYYENIRNYVGLSSQIPVHITKESSFTTEIKTRYVPNTFGFDADSEMSWYFNIENPLPKGTKLSFIDMSGSVPTYYYYICESATTSINLLDFMQMGTEIKIRDLAAENTPAFISNYKQQKGEIVTERLLFVVDFLQVTDWSWVDSKYAGNVTLSHMYDGNEIMDYVGSEGVLDAEYTVYENEVGIEEAAEGYTVAFVQDSYPDNGTAQLNVTFKENDVAVDTRYYEGEFAIKLELLDADTDTVIEMPRGISFSIDGKTYLAGTDNKHAVVPVSEFGSHIIDINNSISGIQAAIGGDTTVKFRATLYSAPEATYYKSIDTGKSLTDTYTIASPVVHSLKIDATSDDTVNLILSKGENLVFDLQTYQQNDSASVVNVEAYAKTETGYTSRVPLTKLFTNSSETLAPSVTTVNNSWTIGSADEGVYRLVFTYAERTEYLYFIVEK